MKRDSAPQGAPDGAHPADVGSDLGFFALWYRVWFFDWLFADMTRPRNVFERNAAWQHNRRMRRYLPVYLRRWAGLSAFAFGLGCLFEQGMQATLMAAACFVGSCVTVPVMAVITVCWVFLSRPEMP